MPWGLYQSIQNVKTSAGLRRSNHTTSMCRNQELCVGLVVFTHSPKHFSAWPGCPVGYLKEPCLQIGWSVRLHWNSNYVIVQTPANDQMCGEGSCSRESPMWQKLRCVPLIAGTKQLAQWAFNHPHPSTAPFHISAFVLPWILLLAITHQGSWGYMPWRRCLKCQNPSQLESWCGGHSGMYPCQSWICSFAKTSFRTFSLWEAQKHVQCLSRARLRFVNFPKTDTSAHRGVKGNYTAQGHAQPCGPHTGFTP